MIAVVDITKNASLIVYLWSVRIVSYRLLHFGENGGWFLDNNVERGTIVVWVWATAAAFKSKHASTLTEWGNVIQPPAFKRELSDWTEESDVVGGELYVDHPIRQLAWLADISWEQGAWWSGTKTKEIKHSKPCGLCMQTYRRWSLVGSRRTIPPSRWRCPWRSGRCSCPLSVPCSQRSPCAAVLSPTFWLSWLDSYPCPV